HMFLHTYESNRRAIRSYEKVGFRALGKRRRFRPSIGYYQEIKMVLDRQTFIAEHGAKLGRADSRELIASSG
ncbi:MAG TPA: hypothetical protein VFB34_03740, partial [Chloroflexota bacterium]|nr:hypothetical protein [Chloroflexota bacterium]